MFNDQYENTIQLDYRYILEPATKELIDKATSKVAVFIKETDKKHLKMLQCLIYNLWLANKLNTWLSISLHRDDYKGQSKFHYKHMSYESVKTQTDRLYTAGLIEKVPGFYYRNTGIGRRTRIKATQMFKSWLNDIEKQLNLVKIDPISSVLVKDNNKNYCKAPNIDLHRRLAAMVDFVNKKQAKHSINIEIRFCENYIYKLKEKEGGEGRGITGLFSHTTKNKELFISSLLANSVYYKKSEKCILGLEQLIKLHRVFNDGSLKFGGRFYCQLQQMPKQLRKRLLIDGEEAIELDYSAIHPRLLYARLGIDYRQDPYVVGAFNRSDMKLVCLVAINSKNKTSALRSLNRKRMNGCFRALMTKEDVKNALMAFQTHHRAISIYFYSNIGKELMWIDSSIAAKIISKISRQGECIVPIHDSFIVRKSLKDELKKQMEAAYNEVVGFEPVIK